MCLKCSIKQALSTLVVKLDTNLDFYGPLKKWDELQLSHLITQIRIYTLVVSKKKKKFCEKWSKS